MTPFKDLPLAKKALTLGVVPTICALFLASIAFIVAAFNVARDNIIRDAEAIAAIVADNVSAAIAFNDRRTASELLNALKAKPEIDLACVFDGDGRLFAAYMAASRACADAAGESDRSADGSIVRTRRVFVGGRPIGDVRVTANLDAVYARTRAQSLGAIGAFLSGVFVAWLLARRMRRWVAAPVLELAATADRVSESRNYALRAERRTRDEVGQLVDSFNAMLNEIQKQERLKDEFLAALSHELRTPLNVVVGGLQIIKTTKPQGDALMKAVERLERNAKSQVRVVEDLLDVSRIVAGKLQLHPEPVDLRAVVLDAADMVHQQARAKRVQISTGRSDEQLLFMGDRQKLTQLFVNLLSNAVKFSHDGGHVAVRIEIEDDSYTVIVRDEGIGIPADFLPHVFERFRQFDGSMTRAHGGLGLGLAITKEIVQLHGGVIEAHSDGPGLGATFIVRLSRASEFTTTSSRPSNVKMA